ncbi:MAG: type II secretion system protein N [Pseudomonadota bacterium]
MSLGLKRGLYIALPVLLIGLFARLPASVAINWILPDNVAVRGISGTIWNGQISAIEAQRIGVGPVEWSLSPLGLLTGKVRVAVEAQVPGGFVETDLAISPSGRIKADGIVAQIDLAPFTRYSSSIGPTQGIARVSADTIVVVDQWPESVVNGTLEVRDLVYAAIGNQPLGSHRIRFNDVDDDPEFTIGGNIESIDGAFDVSGDFDLGSGTRFRMDGLLKLTDQAPRGMDNSIRPLLGAPNSAGQYPFNWEGSLRAPE